MSAHNSWCILFYICHLSEKEEFAYKFSSRTAVMGNFSGRCKVSIWLSQGLFYFGFMAVIGET